MRAKASAWERRDEDALEVVLARGIEGAGRGGGLAWPGAELERGRIRRLRRFMMTIKLEA